MKSKKRGFGLAIRSFEGGNGHVYLVFRTPSGSYHVFQEVNAKDAAEEAFGKTKGITRKMWSEIWKAAEA